MAYSLLNNWKSYFCLAVCMSSLLGAEPIAAIPNNYVKPTEHFLGQISYEEMWKSLDELKVSRSNETLFNEIIKIESPGFFGYHAASGQDFRIIQDIIRVSIEEILEIQLPKDFHFLRFPNDSDLDIDSVHDFFGRHEVIDNNGPLKSKQLLSLNIPLYGGIAGTRGKSCTVAYFATSEYAPKDKIKLEPMMAHFFEDLGASQEEAEGAATSISERKELLNLDQGILLQFFDKSHLSKGEDHYFELIDNFGYAAKARGGSPMEETLPSRYLLDETTSYPQLRLVLSNFSTLNPFDNLAIVRYDNQDPASVALWEDHLRLIIRNIVVDPVKRDQFKAKLITNWSTETSAVAA